MNDVLVTANAAVVSKLLVIAPFPADGRYRQSGVQTGERPQQNRSAKVNPAGLLRRVLPSSCWSQANNSLRVSEAVITSAAFVESGAERVRRFRTGIFGLSQFSLLVEGTVMFTLLFAGDIENETI